MIKKDIRLGKFTKNTVSKQELKLFLCIKHHIMLILAEKRTPCNLHYMYGEAEINALKLNFKCSFWPGLGLPRTNAIVVIPKLSSCQNHLRKKKSKTAKYPWPLRYKKKKKRSVEITMHLGLDNIIKLKFTTNFDRCAILNVLNWVQSRKKHHRTDLQPQNPV